MTRGVKGSTIMAPCPQCGRAIPAHLGHRYCSLACRREAITIPRECVTCTKGFRVYASTLRSSNSSGRFCSRPCYAAWMRTPAARRPRTGRNWGRRAAEARAFAPFCAICGTLKGQLEAHHLLPRKHEGSDEQANLITLCFPHHRQIEAITRRIVLTCEGEPPAEVLAPLAAMLRFRQAATFHHLKTLTQAAA